MTKNAKIGAALVGGYLLGRTKKAKLALGFGMFLLGKKIDLDPRQIGRMLADSPALGSLNDQVRKELVDATRTAATKAVTQRAGSLADSLQQRTQALGAGSGADDEELDEEDDEPRTAAVDDDEVEADGEEGTDGKRKRTPRRTAAASDSKPASRSRSSSGSGRSGSGGKSTPARKRTGGARKTAASGARKARGGDDA
ncbi:MULTISPECIES: hypothetical protein [unclassified Streptomyces]|uniref:hypothetical protein n=1 Tax=unclassified Streptomyces TaxID=2593676 RepID=UPI0008517CDC|nr:MULTISPECIES: hypothetical protein [unclassified Streptomyces]MDQ0700564.1 hypothetical protein [Streptomyces sp. W4I9-2]MDX3486525.1 hypothetical protein [Streptomyces sp. ID05-18]